MKISLSFLSLVLIDFFFMIYFKKYLYLVVLIGFSSVFAGSYDDFFSAIKQNDTTKISELLKRGFDPNTINPDGKSGLLLALQDESNKVAEILIHAPGIKVEMRNNKDESPLMLSALKGNLTLSLLLIKKGADINKTGWTPLHYAATNGHAEIVRLLLDENAYIDAASPNGSTPLMMAAHYGTPEVVKLLLEAGADPLLKNDLQLSALDFATRANRFDSASIIAAFIRGARPKGTW